MRSRGGKFREYASIAPLGRGSLGPSRDQDFLRKVEVLSRRGHAVLRLRNCVFGALDRASAPSGFIGRGRLQFGESGAQMLERGLHMRLIGPRGS